MDFDYICLPISSPNSKQIFLPNFLLLLLLKQTTESYYWCSCACSCSAIHWSMHPTSGWIPKEARFSLPQAYQLPVSPQPSLLGHWMVWSYVCTASVLKALPLPCLIKSNLNTSLVETTNPFCISSKSLAPTSHDGFLLANLDKLPLFLPCFHIPLCFLLHDLYSFLLTHQSDSFPRQNTTLLVISSSWLC